MSQELGQAQNIPIGSSNAIEIPQSEAPEKQLKLDEKISMIQSGEGTGDTYKVLASLSDNTPGYLSAKIDSSQFNILSQQITLVGFGTLNSDNLDEGSINLYFNQINFDSYFVAKDTDDLSEGSTNLYLNVTNFDTFFNTKTTDDLTEGVTNLYFTDTISDDVILNTAARHTHVNIAILNAIADIGSGSIMTVAERIKLAGIEAGAGSNLITSVNSQIGAVILDTDNVLEGSVNFYYTDVKVLALLTPHTSDSSIHFSDLNSFDTGDLAEGDDLYYTDTRVLVAMLFHTGDSSMHLTDLSSFTTDDLSEGLNNLYYSDALVSTNSDVAANTSAQHIHSNKILLDQYTQAESNLALAVTQMHTHTNSSILDDVEVGFTTAMYTKYEGYGDSIISSVLSPLDLTSGILSHDDSDGNKHVPSNSGASQYYVLSSGASVGVYNWQSIDDILVNSGGALFESVPSVSTTLGVQSNYLYLLTTNAITDLNLLTDLELDLVQTDFPAHIIDDELHVPAFTVADQGKYLYINALTELEFTDSAISITILGENYLSAIGSTITANPIRFIHTNITAGANINIDSGTDVISSIQRGIDSSPVSGEGAKSITSSWAFTHEGSTGNNTHVPSTGISGYFLAWDGTFQDISSYVNVDILDYVLAMQQDAILDPGIAPVTGDRYILLNVSALHANFGTITGVGDNDIVEYDGANFIISFNASAATASITVTVTLDINGNPDREWYYSYSGAEWRDRGVSGSIFWSQGTGTLSPLTVGDDILLPTGDLISWGTGSSYITESATNILSFYTASIERFQINITSVDSILPISVNTINEYTATSGVTIDSVLLKDNEVTATIFNVESDTTRIQKDGSNNITFTDAITGTKTLADLASAGTSVEVQTVAALSKTVFLNADIFSLVDTADSNSLKKFTFADAKANYKTYFDTLYVLTNGNGTTANGTAVDLGGNLTSNTVIDLGINNFEFKMGDGSFIGIGGDLGGGAPIVGIDLELASTHAQFDFNTRFSGTFYTSMSSYSDASESYMEFASNDASGTAVVIFTGTGFSYETDISSRNTTNDRWIPDKAYVDNSVGSIVTIGSDNQLPISNLGGTDFEYTSSFQYNNKGLTISDGNDNLLLNTSILAYSGITGTRNVFAGTASGQLATSANDCTFIGGQTGDGHTSGSNCVFIGSFAGDANTTQDANTYIGMNAARQVVGSGNVVVGFEGLRNNTAASNSTVIGYEAGQDSGTASGLVLIGYQAGIAETNSNKLHIANNGSESIIEGNFSAKTLNINASINYFTGSLTDGTPTNAEINVIITNPSGVGYEAIIKDSDGSGAMYKVIYDGSGWYYIQLIAAI